VYDRHKVYKTLSDYQLAVNAHQALYKDKTFKRIDCSIDLAIFNGDLLLAGHVPTAVLRKTAYDRLVAMSGYRRIFNQLAVSSAPIDVAQDNWITTKIRGQIFSDSAIDPHAFKIVTVDQIVYLMGDVLPEEAQRVISITKTCDGVRRVVTLLKYYHLSGHSDPRDGVPENEKA
jgi:osmotically-inducible protein OsmY